MLVGPSRNGLLDAFMTQTEWELVDMSLAVYDELGMERERTSLERWLNTYIEHEREYCESVSIGDMRHFYLTKLLIELRQSMLSYCVHEIH